MRTRIFELRTEVDACDRQIADALARRSRAVAEIHEVKADYGDPARDPVREANVTDAVYKWVRSAGGRYDRGTIERIYAAIFDGCERLEAPLPRPVDGRYRGDTRY